MTDADLLARARSIRQRQAGPLTAEALRELTVRVGIDLATAVLYDHVRSEPPHAPFIDRVDRCEVATPDAPLVLIMPGAFYRHHRHTGADGQRVFDLAADLGWPAERVPVPSLGTMEGNAMTLLAHLAARQDRPVVIVSLSKGGADVRAALNTPGAAVEHVRGWLSLSGLVTGTPLLGWLRARPVRYWGARALLALQRHPFAALRELGDGPGSPLREPFQVPCHIRTVHVVGFPTIASLSHPWALRAHARLADLGPNDGGGFMLADALALPGHVYPVWRADHYLRPARDVRPLLRNLLRIVAQP